MFFKQELADFKRRKRGWWISIWIAIFVVCIAIKPLTSSARTHGHAADDAIEKRGTVLAVPSKFVHLTISENWHPPQAITVGQTPMREVSVVLRLGAGAGDSPAAINAIQLKVLGGLGKRQYKVIHRYQNVASMALFVTPEALAFLQSHPDVVSVTPAQDVFPTEDIGRRR